MRTLISIAALCAIFVVACDSEDDPGPTEPAPCAAGDTKEADDGCNTCTCEDDESWACTEMDCEFITGPCLGKVCGDTCSTCPAGAVCPAVEEFCQLDGSCGAELTSCDEPPLDPDCEGKACGDECFPTAWTSFDDQEEAGDRAAGFPGPSWCTPDGDCVFSTPQCEEPPAEPCANLTCGDMCIPADFQGTGANTPPAAWCQLDGSCTQQEPNCGFTPLVGCDGKVCGETCLTCITGPGEDVYCPEGLCQPDGACLEKEPICQNVPTDPCVDKVCGDFCSKDWMGTGDSPGDMMGSYCNGDGECVWEDEFSYEECKEPPVDACAGKACGEGCNPWANASAEPSDGAMEPVFYVCNAEGQCVEDFELSKNECEEPPTNPCDGKACGDVCSTCAPGAACPAVDEYCNADGLCVSSMEPCEDEPPADPCDDLECGQTCWPDVGTQGGMPDADVAPHICDAEGQCVPTWDFNTDQCPDGPTWDQCYSGADCADGQVCTVDLGECGTCADCPLCGVCCGECVPAGWSPDDQAKLCTEPVASDPYDTTKFELADGGEAVALDVAYSGGCANHIFSACYSFEMPATPAGDAPEGGGGGMAYPMINAYMVVTHDNGDDLCEAYPQETITFGIAELIEDTKAAMGFSFGAINLNLVGTDYSVWIDYQ